MLTCMFDERFVMSVNWINTSNWRFVFKTVSILYVKRSNNKYIQRKIYFYACNVLNKLLDYGYIFQKSVKFKGRPSRHSSFRSVCPFSKCLHRRMWGRDSECSLITASILQWMSSQFKNLTQKWSQFLEPPIWSMNWVDIPLRVAYQTCIQEQYK